INIRMLVDGGRDLESVDEALLEVVQALIRGAKLSEEGLPAYMLRTRQYMEAVSQPAVNIECLRVVRDRPDRCLLEWDGMLFQLFEKGLRQPGRLQEQRSLASGARLLDEHRRVHDILVY